MASDKIILFTDGGSLGNPGPAGAGAVVADAAGRELKRLQKPLGIFTNNEAEYQAVIFGLTSLKRIYGKKKLKELAVEVRLDSDLVASQLRGEYQIKEERLFPFFIKIWNLRMTDFPRLTFLHIPREKNHLADELASEACRQAAAGAGPTLFDGKAPI